MNYFLKANKDLLIYSSIILVLIPILGIKFLISFLGNIILLIFLIPILLLLLAFLGLKFYNSRIDTCSNCGAISFGLNQTCVNCGADLKNISETNKLDKNPSESTIEVKAEEVK